MPILSVVVAAVILCGSPAAGHEAKTVKSERFDAEPGWEGHHNRIVPEHRPTVAQNFGYSRTNFAGQAEGELGGLVTRASEPAFYAQKVGPFSLDEKLTASGSFAFTKTTPGGGVFFGFFRAEQPGGAGRPIGSLGLDFDCEHSGVRLAVRLITTRNQSCGTFITPFIPGKFRPTPIRNDGTRYTWKLDYDPEAADGRGRFTFTLHGDEPQPGTFDKLDIPAAHKEHAHQHFPDVTTFTVDLTEGFKKHGTTFDHFGLMNMTKPGGSLEIYCDDLQFNGHEEEFARDPQWDAAGNRVTYQAKDVAGAHDFGFSPTNYAGGEPGEIGGTFWRSGKYAYYADRVRNLSLDDRLEASGKVILRSGGPDSDMYLGWFNSTNQDTPPTEAGNFLGIHVGGPTRVGHYFHPSLATAAGTRAQAQSGPVLSPATTYEWSLVYDPAAGGGRGAIRVTLGEESVTLPLKEGIRSQGGSFDRFGLFTSNIGGQIVRIYLDDLKYTAARQRD
ncbi:MAG TPA: hypothetical protein VFI31_19975 [Pirellulales bacterium]|nr:hypothetical protein [Pirellulales bacterium]